MLIRSGNGYRVKIFKKSADSDMAVVVPVLEPHRVTEKQRYQKLYSVINCNLDRQCLSDPVKTV